MRSSRGEALNVEGVADGGVGREKPGLLKPCILRSLRRVG